MCEANTTFSVTSCTFFVFFMRCQIPTYVSFSAHATFMSPASSHGSRGLELQFVFAWPISKPFHVFCDMARFTWASSAQDKCLLSLLYLDSDGDLQSCHNSPSKKLLPGTGKLALHPRCCHLRQPHILTAAVLGFPSACQISLTVVSISCEHCMGVFSRLAHIRHGDFLRIFFRWTLWPLCPKDFINKFGEFGALPFHFGT